LHSSALHSKNAEVRKALRATVTQAAYNHILAFPFPGHTTTDGVAVERERIYTFLDARRKKRKTRPSNKRNEASSP
jgi:hypothetical protein